MAYIYAKVAPGIYKRLAYNPKSYISYIDAVLLGLAYKRAFHDSPPVCHVK